MAYNGSIDLISGIRPKNNGEFPLVHAKDVYVDDETRLNAKLEELAGTIADLGLTVVNGRICVTFEGDGE